MIDTPYPGLSKLFPSPKKEEPNDAQYAAYKRIAIELIEKLSETNPIERDEQTFLIAITDENVDKKALNAAISMLIVAFTQNAPQQPEELNNADLNLNIAQNEAGELAGICATLSGDKQQEHTALFQPFLKTCLDSIKNYNEAEINACISTAEEELARNGTAAESPAENATDSRELSEGLIKSYETIRDALLSSDATLKADGALMLSAPLTTALQDIFSQDMHIEIAESLGEAIFDLAEGKKLDGDLHYTITQDNTGAFYFHLTAEAGDADNLPITEEEQAEHIAALQAALPDIFNTIISKIRTAVITERLPEKIIDAESAQYQQERANDQLYGNVQALYNALRSGYCDHRSFVDKEGREHAMIHLPSGNALIHDPDPAATIDAFNAIMQELTDTDKTTNILEIDSLLEASSDEEYIQPQNPAALPEDSAHLHEGVDSLTQPAGYPLTATVPLAEDIDAFYTQLVSVETQFKQTIREHQLGSKAPSTALH